MKRTALTAVLALALAACSQESAAEPTAPAADEPTATPQPTAADEAPEEAAESPEPPTPAAPDDVPEETAVDREKPAPAEATRPPKQAAAKTPAPKPTPKPTAPEPKADETRPAPEANAEPKANTEPKAESETKKPTGRTRIPQSEHVQVQVPAKLQKLLDGDSRMQPWVNKVMGVAEQCYGQVRAQSPKAGGTIVVNVTMHENSRPAPDIKTLPPALSNLVACATGRLFSVRMPLFTGPEGQKHQVKLIFKP